MARAKFHSVLISRCGEVFIKRNRAIDIAREYETLAKQQPENAQLFLQHAEHYRRMV